MLPLDKVVHFLAGAVIAFVVAMFSNPIAGLCAAIAVGMAKEVIYDGLLGQGDPYRWDAIATFLGGVFVTLLFFIKVML